MDEKDAGESDLEAFEDSNSEAGLIYTSHEQFSNVCNEILLPLCSAKEALVEAMAGQRHTCELIMIVLTYLSAPLALFPQPHISYHINH